MQGTNRRGVPRRRTVFLVTMLVATALQLGSAAPASLADSGQSAALAGIHGRMSMGTFNSCVVDGDTDVWCWGAMTSLQNPSQSDIAQRIVDSNGTPIGGAVAVAAGSDFGCSLLATGRAECWGAGDKGQLGTGEFVDAPFPTDVVADETGTPLSGIAQIAVGADHGCALMAGGTIRCWGANAYGQLGDGSTTNRSIPVPVLYQSGTELSGAVAIAAGWLDTCVILDDGSTWCWGADFDGQLGNGAAGGPSASPQQVALPPDVKAAGISTAKVQSHTCVVTEDGDVYCWGANSSGQLGSPPGLPHATPQKVESLAAAVSIGAGRLHTCALLAVGEVRCWGQMNNGRLGTGDDGATGDQPTPQTVVAPDESGDALTGVRAISVGESHACAVLGDWSLVCWGGDGSGELGDGPEPIGQNEWSATPVYVVGVGQLDQSPAASPSSISVTAGVATPISLSGSDPDGDPLTFAVSASPTGGALSAISAPDCTATGCTATVDYTPQVGTVADSFSFTVSDGVRTSDPATVDITVLGPEAPVAIDDAATTTQDTSVVIDVASNDTDPDGNLDLASVVIELAPANGSSSPGGDGTVVYTPAAGFVGFDTFTYSICDTTSLCDTADVTVTVTEAAMPPEAADDMASVGEDGEVDIDVLANDSDPNGDSLSIIEVTAPQHGTATVNPDSTIHYVPAPNFAGADSFEYTIADGTGFTDSASVSITVGGVDDPPIVDAGGPYSGSEGAPVTVAGSATDPDGTPAKAWSYAATNNVDPGATCVFTDAAASETTITCTDDGTYLITLTATESGVVVSATAELAIGNVTPTVNAGEDQTVPPGDPVTVTASFDDPGANDTHTAQVDWGDGNGWQSAPISGSSVEATLSTGYDSGVSATVTVEVCDDDGGCGADTIQVSSDICDIRGTPGDDLGLMGTEDSEVICGLGGNDIIYGGGGNDIILGGAGDDTLIGGPGDDILDGDGGPDSGPGVDTADYSNSVAAVSVDLVEGIGTGEGLDQLTGIENLEGSAFGDRLQGDQAANVIRGNDGNDVINGRGGDDRLDGGNQTSLIDGPIPEPGDRLTFAGGPLGVSVDLEAGMASGWGSDTVTGFENVFGTDYGDDISGDDHNNRIYGAAGNDVINGRGGDDMLFGGDDNPQSGGPIPEPGDRVSFAGSPKGVTVDLAAHLAGGWGRDILVDFENVFGSDRNDTIRGDGGDNRIFGAGGNDNIDGRSGNDILFGGAGNDNIGGGAGDDVLLGDVGSDKLEGGTGNDTMFGGAANDLLVDGSGADSFNGGDGNRDRCRAAGGDDTLTACERLR